MDWDQPQRHQTVQHGVTEVTDVTASNRKISPALRQRAISLMQWWRGRDGNGWERRCRNAPHEVVGQGQPFVWATESVKLVNHRACPTRLCPSGSASLRGLRQKGWHIWASLKKGATGSSGTGLFHGQKWDCPPPCKYAIDSQSTLAILQSKSEK
eukprot:scaffold225138_cov28-Tisochrysis_lutea.AAC.1